MKEQKLRFIAAVLLVGTHVFVPLYILFTNQISQYIETRMDVALAIAPVTAVYVMTIVIFAGKNRHDLTQGRDVNILYCFVTLSISIGYVVLIWLTLYFADSLASDGDEVVKTVKVIISIVELFYAGIFANVMDGLFENSEVVKKDAIIEP